MKIYGKQNRSSSRFKKIFNLKSSQNKPDFFLVGIIFFILIFGLVMLSSASTVESYTKFGSTYHLFFRQLIFGLLPGLAFFYFFSRFDYKKLQGHLVLYLVFLFILLGLVFVPGVGANYGRASSWINIAGVSFQPAEIVKLLLVLFLAGWFSARSDELNQDFWNGLVPFAAVVGLIAGLIILQPDMGTLIVVALIAMVIYWVAGGHWKHIVSLVALGAGAAGVLIAIAPYRAARLLTFLHPEIDPQGIGYQVNQALLAVGSGGWFGVGLGQSRQKFAYLPEAIGDSIFAVISEEIGFIFSALLIIAFVLLFFRGLKIIKNVDNDFGRLVAIGIISWFTLQAFVNIGAMVGVMPLTGIPLPFVSYGGTALMSVLAASGILVNISRQTK